MLSVVCVYNNAHLIKDKLQASLGPQTAPFELITIDNTESKFTSAAEALNYGGATASGEYIIFVHQDMCLIGKSWMEEVEIMLDSLPDLGVAGIAGRPKGSAVLSNAVHGNPPRPVSTKTVKEPVSVQTLDECLFIIPRRVFKLLKFDESVCTGWHLYAVDYCLSSQLLGFATYVLPLPVYHFGKPPTPMQPLDRLITSLVTDHLPLEYYKILKKVLKKHKNNTDRIYTVIDDWSTTYPLVMQRILKLCWDIPNNVAYNIKKRILN